MLFRFSQKDTAAPTLSNTGTQARLIFSAVSAELLFRFSQKDTTAPTTPPSTVTTATIMVATAGVMPLPDSSSAANTALIIGGPHARLA